MRSASRMVDREGQADFVYSRFALHHLPDSLKAIALDRMRKLLSSGGICRLWDVVYDFSPAEHVTWAFRWRRSCRYADPMESTLSSWGDFNVAIAGAGAALGGLLIVALSVNIKQIAESRGLAARAGAAIAALILGVVLACAALIPDQPLWVFGVEVLAGTLAGGVIAILAARAILQDDTPGRPRNWDTQHIASFVLPLAIYAVGGVLLVLSVPAGLLVVALATIVALVGAVIFSWVALVEILR